MAFDWDTYLAIAKDFQTKTDGQPQNNTNEAIQRTAISRAYYAVYHLAVDYAKAHLGYIPNQGGHNQFHADIRSVYQSQLGNPDHQEVKKMLARLHKARIDSDYKADNQGNLQALLASVILESDRIKSVLTK